MEKCTPTFVHDLNQFVTVQLLEGNACCPIARQALQRPRVGQRSRATIDRKSEEHSLQDRQFRTSCRSRVHPPMLEAFRLLHRHHRTRWGLMHQWGRWIQRQSLVRCRDTRSCHSMDSIKSVQHKDFARVGEEVIKIFGAVASTESWKNWHLDGIWQILGRLIVESLYFNTHRSKTDGIVERAVRRIQEGISAVLLHSGLDERSWSDSMECYCYLRNVQDLLADGKTPCERRFEEPFKGPIIPFGAMVEDDPSSP